VRANENWWETFFTGLIVDFWRAAMPPEATRAEADFFEKRLALSPGARLLDVPCGDGRLSLELARRDYAVTGVDISEDFLDAARERGAVAGIETVAWRRSDMRDLPWEAFFDGAFCGGSSFGYLGDAGDLDFLRAVARALKPGSRFAIDAVKAMEVVLPRFRERHELTLGDIRFEAENRYDHRTGWMENRYVVSRGDRTETRLARHRIYAYREVATMLQAAGFENVEGFGSLAGEPFGLESGRLLLVAARGDLDGNSRR
jgi:SAM-dependent methyltransferase